VERRGKKVLETGRIAGGTEVISAKERMKIKCGSKKMKWNSIKWSEKKRK
jgi:hypothetical protein